MGLFNRTAKRADANPTTTNDLVDDVILRALLTGEVVDAHKAMSIPAVASSVNRIANLVSILPVKLYEVGETDGKPTTTEVKDDLRTHLLNVDSGDTLDQFAIKRNLVRDYLIDKGGFLYISKSKKGSKSVDDIDGLRYIPPKQITAVINNVNPLEKSGQYLVLGEHYEQFEFVSVLLDTDNGFLGLPRTKQINDTLAAALSNILYELGITLKGGSKKGFLQSDKVLSDGAMKQLKAAWRELYSNTSENVVVLNSGVKFQEANDTAREMQIDERKKTLATELTAIFGIHNDVFDDVFRDAVLPVLEAIESALNKNLLNENEKKNHFFKFDTKEVLKAQLIERYKAYEIASKIGVITKNEIRETENLAPIDGLDVVSMGLGDVVFDVKTKQYYTPNTGDTKKFGDPADAETIDEAGADMEAMK